MITNSAATAAVGSPFMTPSTAPLSTVFSQDGRYVYSGSDSGRTFAGFAVDATAGSLTPLAGSPYDSGRNFPLA
ncbi:MAG: hypothetical protein WA771_13035 [Chthoniobacterales bacterium]